MHVTEPGSVDAVFVCALRAYARTSVHASSVVTQTYMHDRPLRKPACCAIFALMRLRRALNRAPPHAVLARMHERF